jgi:hypothetical protein
MADFALASFFGWWKAFGAQFFKDLKYLLLVVDDGGLKDFRVKSWKLDLQNLAEALKAPIFVAHFPPATKKWLVEERRLFSFVSSNWRGESLASYLTTVSLIGRFSWPQFSAYNCSLDRRGHYPSKKNYKGGLEINENINDSGINNYSFKPIQKRF